MQKEYVSVNVLQFLNAEEKLFWIGVFSLCASIVLYVSFVGFTVVSLIAEKKITQEKNILEAPVVELEAKYMQLSSLLTLDEARKLGFYEVKSVSRIARSPSLSLALEQ